MLQNIRDNSQGIVAKIIIGLIIGVFALFGAESIVGGFMNNATVAEVNGDEITEPQLAASIQNLINSVGGNLGDLDEELVREIALGQLIEDLVLMQSANRAGMVISSDTIDRAIINTPQFQIGGVFDADLALRTMGAQSFTPQSYRATLADQMLIRQLSSAYSATTFVTQAELEQLAALTTQTRDLRYLSVTLGTRTLGEAIPADDIESYYMNNQSQFMQEEELAIDYVVLEKNVIFNEVELDAARIQAQYELERDSTTSSAERRAAHILFETGGNLSEAEAITRAAEIKIRIDAGEDFAELALEFSNDIASARDGGDIGFTDGSAFPDSIEAALTALEVGQVSEPVVSEFGVHLVKLTEYDIAEFPPFEEVAERIERDLKSTEVDALYFGRLETLANLAFETGDLQDISAELGLEIRQSDFFTRNGGNDRFTSDNRVVEAAFSADVLLDGNNSDIIEFGTTDAMVLRVRDHNDAVLIPLEEVRGEIAALLRGQLERDRARALGEEILAALQAGESIDELVAANELEWITAEVVTRNQPGVNAEVLQAAFNIAPSEDGSNVYHGTVLNNGTFVVIELNAVNPGNLDNLNEEERNSLANAIVQRSGRGAFDSYLRNLRNSADISQ